MDQTASDKLAGLMITWVILIVMVGGGLLGWMTNLILHQEPTDPDSWYTKVYISIRQRPPAEGGWYLRAAPVVAMLAVYLSCTLMGVGIWLVIQGLIEGWLIHGPTIPNGNME